MIDGVGCMTIIVFGLVLWFLAAFLWNILLG